MIYKQTKETLDNLYTNLDKHFQSALKDMQNEHYKSASNTLAKAIGEYDREMERAEKEEALPNTGLVQDTVPRVVVESDHQRMDQIINEIRALKVECDHKYTNQCFATEQRKAQDRKEQVNEKREAETQFNRSYVQLVKLKQQSEPYEGIKGELDLFLKRAKQIHANKAMSTPELTQVMNATYDRLTGGPKEKFDHMVQKLNTQHSLPLKLLGAALIVLGTALAAAAVFFAPAIITAAGTGLAASLLFTAGTAATSTGLAAGGTACFFHKTEKMKLANAGQELAAKDLEQNHFAPVAS